MLHAIAGWAMCDEMADICGAVDITAICFFTKPTEAITETSKKKPLREFKPFFMIIETHLQKRAMMTTDSTKSATTGNFGT